MCPLMADPTIFDLSGRVAVVTGGGTGIGRATAHVLGAWGASVVLASRRTENLEHVANELDDGGVRSMVVPTDVQDLAACRALVDATVEGFGRIDILVNNAGGSRGRDDGSWTDDDWDHGVTLNLTSVWVLSRAAASRMIAGGGGSIVNISSATSMTPRPAHAPYSIAKAAVNHLTTVLATEYGPSGVRVNCVAPGIIKTEGFVRAMESVGRDPDAYDPRFLTGHPGEALDIAYPVLFLASGAAAHVNGETLYVGGGPRYYLPPQ
jgi:NAD(P)-dependent dehydrogenase (short-subunit alcohol dehydrogenase family)